MDFGVIWPYLGLVLALFGATFGIVQSIRIERKLKKYEPLVKGAFSIMGKIGKTEQMNTQVAEEVEGALKEGAFQMLETKYPELGLIMGWLEENKPEIFGKIMDNPQIAVNLYNKWAPKIMGLIGKGSSQQKKVMYDV